MRVGFGINKYELEKKFIFMKKLQETVSYFYIFTIAFVQFIQKYGENLVFLCNMYPNGN